MASVNSCFKKSPVPCLMTLSQKSREYFFSSDCIGLIKPLPLFHPRNFSNQSNGRLSQLQLKQLLITVGGGTAGLNGAESPTTVSYIPK